MKNLFIEALVCYTCSDLKETIQSFTTKASFKPFRGEVDTAKQILGLVLFHSARAHLSIWLLLRLARSCAAGWCATATTPTPISTAAPSATLV